LVGLALAVAMQSSNRKYLPRLDMLRAVAAWWVVLHHCFTMIPKSMLAETTWTDSLNPLPVVVTAPWIPLTLFMVVSGYSIGRGLSGHDVRWRGYLTARILRVGPLYWLLLALGVLTGARTVAQYLGIEQESPWTFLEAVLMVPTTSAYTPFPWLATAWSVRIEVVLYLFVPALVWVLRRWRPVRAVIAIVAGCLVIIAVPLLAGADAWAVLYANVPGRLLEFAGGLLLAYLGPRGVARTTAVRCLAVALLVMVTMAYVSNHSGGVHAMPGTVRGVLYTGGLVVALLLVLWAEADHVHGTHPVARGLVRLGQWSYSTYLWHFTVLAFIAVPLSARMTIAWNLPVWPHLLIGTLLTVALTVPLSFASFRWIETPFLGLRPHYVVPAPQASAQSQR